jgi:hypothetical protein
MILIHIRISQSLVHKTLSKSDYENFELTFSDPDVYIESESLQDIAKSMLTTAVTDI